MPDPFPALSLLPLLLFSSSFLSSPSRFLSHLVHRSLLSPLHGEWS
jgi:hypothetical protein